MKKIIILCLIGLFISNIVFCQTTSVPKFSLTEKYLNPKIDIPNIGTFSENKSYSLHSSSKQTNRQKTDWPFIVLAGSYLALSALDLYITYGGIKLEAKEVNPFMAMIIDNKPLAISVKMGLSIFVVYSYSQLKKTHKTEAYIILGAIAILQGYIVYHNLSQLSGYKGP